MTDIRSVNVKDGVISAVETGTECTICGDFIPCEPYMKVFPICRECRKRLKEMLYQKHGECNNDAGLFTCPVCGGEMFQNVVPQPPLT